MKISKLAAVSLAVAFLAMNSFSVFAIAAKAQAPKTASKTPTDSKATTKTTATTDKAADMHKPDSYWKSKLDSNTYNVTRCSATEVPFTGKYWNNHATGEYRCSNCGALLFESKDKFDSGTGWPSFTKPAGDSVAQKEDHTMGMNREEVICKHCGAHLGHVFADGPAPTNMRYCINSASLNFDKQDANASK